MLIPTVAFQHGRRSIRDAYEDHFSSIDAREVRDFVSGLFIWTIFDAHHAKESTNTEWSLWFNRNFSLELILYSDSV